MQEINKDKETKKKSSVINQWLEINNSLVFYKWLSLGLILITGVLVFMVFYFANEDPVVISIDGENKNYFTSKRANLQIVESDVEKYIERFVLLLNKWDELNTDIIIKNIYPFVTEGLRKRLETYYKTTLEKEFEGQKITQDIANLKVAVTKDHVIASFDKVLRVNNIPLVIPTEFSFELTKGAVTNWNLLGLYVNGITEHKGD